LSVTQMSCPHRARNFSYLLTAPNDKDCLVIDPSFCYELLINAITEKNLNLKYIIHTHEHQDHVYGTKTLKNIFPEAQIVTHHLGNGELKVADGDVLEVGELDIQIMHTPGHTPEDICLFTEGELFTGDVLFVGKVGGTHDMEAAKTQFNSLIRLAELPGHTIVYPGHNNGHKPSSTIAEECDQNPFMVRLNNFSDFWWLKNNWGSFKEQHGLT